ncbi:unnamed protein product [Prunus armeniaca]|uniref:Uncharacterized protein n=1 Tax=Prunus armeniaca TaxID=36596 RepID=A0A6J5XX70_PRUAR|nr:unnamed protein product [Prunus armeniaca]
MRVSGNKGRDGIRVNQFMTEILVLGSWGWQVVAAKPSGLGAVSAQEETGSWIINVERFG